MTQTLEEFPDLSKRIREETETQEYMEEIENLNNKFNSLRDDVEAAKEKYLKMNGFECLEIDDREVFVPTRVPVKQVIQLVQSIPPDAKDEFVKYYLLDSEMRQDMNNSEDVQKYIQKRRDLVKEIESVYQTFLSDYEYNELDTQKQIIALLSAFGEIDSEIIAHVVDCSPSKAGRFNISEDGVVYKTRRTPTPMMQSKS